MKGYRTAATAWITAASILLATAGASLAASPGTAPQATIAQAKLAAAAPASQSIYTFLIGTWLGPALADTGGCAAEYAEWTFFRNAEYSYTQNADYGYIGGKFYDCGGFTNAGSYRVANGVISLHWVRCNFPCAPGTVTARLRLLGRNAIELIDQTRVYEYYRQ
jgi:hypothetical protein